MDKDYNGVAIEDVTRLFDPHLAETVDCQVDCPPCVDGLVSASYCRNSGYS